MTDGPQFVLLVEGDILVRHPLAEYLRECGFRVLEASHGDEAMLVLAAPGLKIDVVLTDMATPGGGFALRQWINARALPVQVILAGSTEAAVKQAGDICNEGPALSKPYEHHLVLQRIRQSLSGRKA